MIKRELSTCIDGIDGKPITLNACLFEPDEPATGAVFCCLPGGGVSRDLFDLGTIDEFDYSFASRMTKYGHSVITMDHPGIATNAIHSGHPYLNPRQAADYIAQALSAMLISEDISGKLLVGIGHSMGGMTSILLQGRHQIFQGLCLFGSSAGGLEWGLDDNEKTYVDRPDAIARDLQKLSLAKFKAEFASVMHGPSGDSILFGGATPAVTQRLRDIGTKLYAAGGLMGMIRGAMIKEVEAIDVPLFFAFGDHDIGVPPHEAPLPFINAVDPKVVILDQTGHNSLAFPSIECLCSELDNWVTHLAR